MSGASVQIRRGSRFEFDGELFEVTEFISAAGTYEVVLQGPNSFRRKSVVDLLADPSARLIADEDGPEPDDPYDPAAIALLGRSPADMKAVREKAEHIREVTTGYRSGSPELALEGEPRPEYDPARKLMERYNAKCKELGVSDSTLRRWVRAYNERGEAGLVARRKMQEPKIDPRWVAAADGVREVAPCRRHSPRKGLQPGLQTLLRKRCNSYRERADSGHHLRSPIRPKMFATHPVRCRSPDRAC